MKEATMNGDGGSAGIEGGVDMRSGSWMGDGGSGI